MRFIVSVGGDHAEGHEGRARFDKIVAAFLENLHVNGFAAETSVATHDFATLVDHMIGADEVLDEMDEILGAVVTETSGEQAAVLSVTFASAAAAKLADEHNLTDTDFVGLEPSGAGGFITDDVREAIKAKK